MIRNEQLSQGIEQNIKKALDHLDFIFGSRLDLQILASGSQEETVLQALILQGGKLPEVNDARKEANLHALPFNKNNKIILEDWIQLLKEKKGLVFVVLNGWNRSKSNKVIDSGINSAIDQIENIHFDKIEGLSADIFFVYTQEDELEKKDAEIEEKAPEKKDAEIEEKAPEKKKTSRKKTEKNTEK